MESINNQFNYSTFHGANFNFGKEGIPTILTAPTASVPSTFLGRETELQDIRRLLGSGNTLALVNSEGGMGKTTLAAAYWNLYHEQYKHLVWLFCENGILSAMRSQLPQPLGLQEAMNAHAGSLEKQHEFLKNNLANLDKDCLLVLDNANDTAEIKAFLAAMNGLGWHVLMTSRCTKVLPNSANEYPISSLPPHLAKQLFKGNYSETGPDFEALLDRFLKAVGYNTLCIEIFSKNLREGGPWGYTFADFLRQLEKGGLFLGENSFDILTEYTGNVRKTAQSSDEIIRALYNFADLSAEATDLLIRFSLLPAENHTPELLLALLPNDNKQTLKRQLDGLAQKGWLATDTKTYRVSPVVQKIVLHQHTERRWTLAEPMIKQLHTIFEHEGYHSKNIATAAPYAALVFGLVENIDAANTNIAILFHRLWIYFTATGNLAQAMDTAMRMREVCEQYEDKYYLATSYEKLGNTQTALGNLNEALTFYEDEIKLFTALYESDPNNVNFKNGLAISYSKLGDTQTMLGNLDQALKLYEDQTRLFEALYESYPNNVDYKNGLAVSYSKLGETQTALGHLDQALKLYEKDLELTKALYKSYPNNVNFKNGLAISYSKLGDTQTALDNLNQALKLYEDQTKLFEELYETYPNNVEFKNNLAISYEKLGNTQIALGNFDQALKFYEERSRLGKKLYESYPNNVEFKNGLAVSFYKLGAFSRDQLNDNAKAKGYFQQAEKLWVELVQDAPQYVQFQEFLGIMQADIKALD